MNYDPPSTEGATPVELDAEGFEIVGNEALSGHMFGQAETLPPIMRQAEAVPIEIIRAKDAAIDKWAAEATAKATAGDNASAPPKTASALLRASMASQKDEAETQLQGIEAQIIVAEETAEAGVRQARAEYEQTLLQAKRKMNTLLDRLGDDRDLALAQLEASKADVLDIVAMLSAGIEAGSAQA